MNNILTQNDGNNQLGIGSTQINILGITGNTLDITQGTTSFMSISNSSSSEKISVKKPITINNNLLTIKSTAKIENATANSLFYIDDNNELKTLGIGTTDEYLRMGFNRPAWGPKTFAENAHSSISYGYIEYIKVGDNHLTNISTGSVLGFTGQTSHPSNITSYDTGNDSSFIIPNNGAGLDITLEIKFKYDTNFFDISLKEYNDTNFSSNETIKNLEIVDNYTYKYIITSATDNTIYYLSLYINSINSFQPSNKIRHNITIRKDDTKPLLSSIAYYDTGTSNTHNGPYKNGDVIDITATFNESIKQSPLPKIALSGSGITDISATNMTYVNSTTFKYPYTIPTGNSSSVTITISDAYDMAYNKMDDNNSNTIAIDNTEVPISSSSLATDNSTVTLIFQESVYSNVNGSGTPTVNNFSFSISSASPSLSSTTPSSIQVSNSNKTYVLGISLSGTPNGSETLTISQHSSNKIYDSAGNEFTNTVDVTLNDKTAPTIDTYDPSHTSTISSNLANIILTFNEDVDEGSGNIVLTPSSGDSPITIDVTTSLVTFSSNVCTINPSSNLDATGVTYTVTMASGVIKDTNGNDFAGISGTTYQFNSLDTTAPTVSSYSPAQGATGQTIGNNITLTFNENIQAGTGNITLTPNSGTTLTIPISDSQITIPSSGNTLTINPTYDLQALTTWTVTMPAGIVKDSSNNNLFLGISGNTYQFTTADQGRPSIVSINPGNNAAHIDTNKTITLTFSETVSVGSSKYMSFTPHTTTNPTRTTKTILLTSSMISGTGSNCKCIVTLSTNFLDYNTRYTVTTTSGSFKDISNNTTELSGSTLVFTTKFGEAWYIKNYASYGTSSGNPTSNGIDGIPLKTGQTATDAQGPSISTMQSAYPIRKHGGTSTSYTFGGTGSGGFQDYYVARTNDTASWSGRWFCVKVRVKETSSWTSTRRNLFMIGATNSGSYDWNGYYSCGNIWFFINNGGHPGCWIQCNGSGGFTGGTGALNVNQEYIFHVVFGLKTADAGGSSNWSLYLYKDNYLIKKNYGSLNSYSNSLFTSSPSWHQVYTGFEQQSGGGAMPSTTHHEILGIYEVTKINSSHTSNDVDVGDHL